MLQNREKNKSELFDSRNSTDLNIIPNKLFRSSGEENNSRWLS